MVVHGDPDRLQQVLANLLDNARKNAPPDTPIRVGLERVDGHARLVVEDEGGGVDPDQMERIFEKFVRGRDGSVTGTGLGLYISRRIVEEHGGRIWAESTPGEHTRFVVELPVPRGGSATSRVGRQLAVACSPCHARRTTAPVSVLLVDDEEMIRELARLVLERAGATVLDEAEDGVMALERYRARTPPDRARASSCWTTGCRD